jgi:hypothetical protein
MTGGSARFRAVIEDAAGNPGAAAAEASLVGQLLDPAAGPQLAPPDLEGPAMVGPDLDSHASQTAEPPRTPLEWPSNNMFAADRRRTTPNAAAEADPFAARDVAGSSLPPFQNAYTGGASLSGLGSNNESAPLANGNFAPSLLPSQPIASSPATIGEDWSRTSAPVSPPQASPSSAAGLPANNNPAAADDLGGTTWVNSLTFDLDYDIQTVGPWGVAKVELWGTKDGGRQWQSLGVDQDNRSPMRVTVPAAGLYGFRIIVDGGNGVPAPTPQSGEAPELIVGVDLAPPRAELRIADPGQGPFAGQLIIRWSAQDENLAPRPIALFYSAAAKGPWSTIATDIDNSGEYAWRLGREAPPRAFLRLEVRDNAGNVDVQQSPTAIDLSLPRPTGRLRNVRPVEVEQDRFRTASSARPAEG